MPKRAALLPAGGDPFVIAYWLRHYEQLWADEVDELHIRVCGQNEPAVRDYIREIVDAAPHAKVDFLRDRTDHGAVLQGMAEESDAELVLACEDDAFVRHRHVVEGRFWDIEDGIVDVIGTARGNADDPLIARAAELWGETPKTATGETGWSLYPCFLFGWRAQLLSTVPEGVMPTKFSATRWSPGERVIGLDYTVPPEWLDRGAGRHTDMSADTFTAASWQLRAKGLRIRSEAAYRSDSAHKGVGRRNVDGGTNTGDAPWFHVGSLSSGYGGTFLQDMSPEGYAALLRNLAQPGELYDWHKRFSWWTRVSECWDGGIPEFHDRYVSALHQFMRDCGADPAEVARWRREYDPLVTWAE